MEEVAEEVAEEGAEGTTEAAAEEAAEREADGGRGTQRVAEGVVVKEVAEGRQI